MRYSVYDYTRRAYDYYEAPGPGGTHAGSPPMGRTSDSDIGAPPDAASWRLPAGARKVGEGALPQGRIASLGGADWLSSPTPLIMLGVAALVAWRIFR